MPFSFHEDFSVRDERGRSYQIDIEENSALSNGRARITDGGKYHLTLNGNRHFLAVPSLRNFRLKLVTTAFEGVRAAGICEPNRKGGELTRIKYPWSA